MEISRTPRSSVWYGLDNAAILYTSISDNKNTNVFRLACELRESIDPAALQEALDIAIKSFSYFRTIMRRGLFWFYLEPTDFRPKVILEDERPCSRIFYKDEKRLLFQVSYYNRRINLEVFHAIADGSGALELLRSIVYHYIVIKHREELPARLPVLDKSAPPAIQAEDSFDRHYDPHEKQSPFKTKAYSIAGTMLPANGVRVISGSMSSKRLLGLAKSKGVTITAYLCALMICGIYNELMPRRVSSKIIGVTIPVDLRGHFSSETARNFFSVIDISYNFHGNPVDFDDVIKSVSLQLSEKLDPKALSRRMNYGISVQKNIFARFTPLFIKNFVLSAAYRKGEQSTSCALSNMGRITMPDAFSPFIQRFSCLLNPTPLHRLKACVCSFGDDFVINFTSCIAETGTQKYFFRYLAENGVDVTITTNMGDNYEAL